MSISSDLVENVVISYLALDDLYQAAIADPTLIPLLQQETNKRIGTQDPMFVAISNDDLDMFRYLLPRTNVEIFQDIAREIFGDGQDPFGMDLGTYFAYYIIALEYNAPNILKYLIRREGNTREFLDANDIVSRYVDPDESGDAFTLSQAFADPEFAFLLWDDIPKLSGREYYQYRPDELVQYLNFINTNQLKIKPSSVDQAQWLDTEDNIRYGARLLLQKYPEVVPKIQAIWNNSEFAQLLPELLPETKIIVNDPLYDDVYQHYESDLVEELVRARDDENTMYTYNMLPIVVYPKYKS